MITVSHLTMRLAGGGHQVTILDDITLEIPDKQRVAIVGPSGSGKSTLLGLIAGLDRPTSGSIMLNGVEISTMRESALARYRRDHIGYIFQSFHLIPTLTALENVLVPVLAGAHRQSHQPPPADRSAPVLGRSQPTALPRAGWFRNLFLSCCARGRAHSGDAVETRLMTIQPMT